MTPPPDLAAPAQEHAWPFRSRVAERAAVVVLLFLFVLQSAWSVRWKNPPGDAWTHFVVGEYALGVVKDIPERYIWQATMPMSALNVLGGWLRVALSPVLGPPTDPWDGPHAVHMPSILWTALPTVLLGAGMLLAVYAFGRRYLGPTAGFWALFAGTFEPGLIGHARFIASDLHSAAFFAFTLLAYGWYLERRSWPRLVLLALVAALAQVAKATLLLLYPLMALHFIAVGIVQVLRQARGAVTDALPGYDPALAGLPPARALALVIGKALVIATLCAAVLSPVLHLAYAGIDARQLTNAGNPEMPERLRENLPALYTIGEFLPWVYRVQLAIGLYHNKGGHPAYFFGTIAQDGHLLYFPLAILLKAPLPLLLLAAVGLGAQLRAATRRPWFAVAAFLTLGFLLYFILRVRVNIGIRYILPVFPGILLAAGLGVQALCAEAAGARRRWFLGAAAALGLWMMVEAARIFPHHESYYNQAAGGPYRGWLLIADSNSDWDQDRLATDRWVARQRRPAVATPFAQVRGLVAVRTGVLVGHNQAMRDTFAWLREGHRPVGFLTPSIVLYDVPYVPFPSVGIRPAEPHAGLWLGGGWGEPTGNGARWATHNAEVFFHMPPAAEYIGEIVLQAPAEAPVALRVRVNSNRVAMVDLQPGERRAVAFTWRPRDGEQNFWLQIQRRQSDSTAWRVAVESFRARPRTGPIPPGG